MTDATPPLDPNSLPREDRVLIRNAMNRLLMKLIDEAGGTIAATPDELGAYGLHTVLMTCDGEAGCLRFRLVSFEDLKNEQAYKTAKG